MGCQDSRRGRWQATSSWTARRACLVAPPPSRQPEEWRLQRCRGRQFDRSFRRGAWRKYAALPVRGPARRLAALLDLRDWPTPQRRHHGQQRKGAAASSSGAPLRSSSGRRSAPCHDCRPPAAASRRLRPDGQLPTACKRGRDEMRSLSIVDAPAVSRPEPLVVTRQAEKQPSAVGTPFRRSLMPARMGQPGL